ncbi:6422_t:CDS:2, partial [Acaulospora colombiana]
MRTAAIAAVAILEWFHFDGGVVERVQASETVGYQYGSLLPRFGIHWQIPLVLVLHEIRASMTGASRSSSVASRTIRQWIYCGYIAHFAWNAETMEHPLSATALRVTSVMR